jgi:hypothetical protein
MNLAATRPWEWLEVLGESVGLRRTLQPPSLRVQWLETVDQLRLLLTEAPPLVQPWAQRVSLRPIRLIVEVTGLALRVEAMEVTPEVRVLRIHLRVQRIRQHHPNIPRRVQRTRLPPLLTAPQVRRIRQRVQLIRQRHQLIARRVLRIHRRVQRTVQRVQPIPLHLRHTALLVQRTLQRALRILQRVRRIHRQAQHIHRQVQHIHRQVRRTVQRVRLIRQRVQRTAPQVQLIRRRVQHTARRAQRIRLHHLHTRRRKKIRMIN